MSKRLLLLIAGLVAAAMIGFTVFSKLDSHTASEGADPAFGQYISAFTSGIISNESPIRILLTNEMETPVEIGKPLEKNLFEFSPSIKGTTVWLDSRTIEFRPEKPLPPNTSYKAEFYLSNVLDVPDEFETFIFDFQTMQQSFEVFADRMTTTDKKTLRTQRLEGTLATADVSDPTLAEKIVSVIQNGKSLPITWIHEGNRNMHRFTVEGIQRTEKPGKVEVKWDGSVIDVDLKGNKVIDIPALGDFKVVDVKVIQSPEQYAVLQFSDPIEEGQVLDGLITLTGGSALKYIIEDNEIKIFPQARQAGPRTITAELGVKNILGMPLKERYVMEIMFEEMKPQVELIGKGVILPNSNGLIFPFRAVSLKAIDVKVLKIYEKNIPQFLQVNNLEGQRELRRVGKVVLKKTIQLTSKSAMDLGRWNNYSFDLAQLIKAEPGAIYKVIISFKKEYANYTCTDSGEPEENEYMQEVNDGTDDDDEHEWDYYGDYYYDDYEYYDYDYQERDNPCNSSYYRNKEVSRNILASDLGLIAKRGTDGSMHFVVTNLVTTKPVANATVELLDYQLQILKSLKTDAEGMCEATFKKKPFLMLVKSGTQRGYMKLDDASSLSVSAFDVSGEEVQKGIKGYIYGERGVWRPGDTLFLSFILEDKLNTLPKNHPVQFELMNPQGQVFRKIMKTVSVNGFYNFTTTTEKSSPTGNWTARVKVGGAWFSKNIKIETIMPNRMKIKLDFGDKMLSVTRKDQGGNLEVKWLHGAIAKNLNAKVEVTLSQMETSFKKYEDYHFDDIARTFTSEAQTIFDEKINAEGKAIVKPAFATNDAAPGMLRAGFKVRVFEQGGAFSIDQFSLPYSPYTSYVGIKVPEGNKFSGMLVTDTNHVVKVASVDSDGKPVSKKRLKVQVYKVGWRWWWDSYDGDLANYVGNEYRQPIQDLVISTVNGKGQFNLRVNRPDWGRFYVCVTDEESGHRTGQTVYIDWPAWAGASPKGNEGATLLSFSSDKKQYNVGEDVKLTIPSSSAGRALISIESGSKVIKAFWTETKKGETPFTFKVTADMTPNVYVNITLVQPHSQTINDLPIRLYGVVPITVEDPTTHLTPVIKTPEVWKPEQKATLSISEKDGKEMTYTVAIVDEGLLDLTRFKTPDPWASFYAREALGVKTWDMYDMVMGAYGAELSRILAIGGDGALDGKGGNKANRFKPMVKFLGPFHLKKGQTANLEFMMPQYVGSVRTMVIAGYKGAYGSSDKTTPVRKPLMILGTLPRVVGPGEEVDLPVTVFAMEKQVKNVKVEIQVNNFFSPQDGTSKSISFKETGDDVVNFKLKVNSLLGVGKVKIIATSGSEKATYDIEIDVRNPNPKVTNVLETVIEAGKTWDTPYTPAGMTGTNKGTIELSSIPAINLGERLKYLIEYPHGCVEQTTSSVFPQLYLSDIMELNSDFKTSIDRNIKAGIERLKLFQTASGGMSYWAGQYDADEWGTSYAGHFMIEAESKGYALPAGYLENWKRYQRTKANSWSAKSKDNYYYYNNDLEQAYRLYTLAVAKAPELGAMNRLKEYPQLSVAAKWRLAAAYIKAGQPEVAKKLITGLAYSVPKYREMGYTYGSNERDEAMILETLTLLNMKAKAAPVLKSVSAALSSNSWMSTQTTAYCLISVSKFASSGGASNEMKYNVKINNNPPISLNTKLPVKQIDMGLKGAAPGNISVSNNGTGIIFARVILEGIPETGDQTAIDNDLNVQINYTTMEGGSIDVSKLEQGSDFIAEVKITNPGSRGEYLQMALSQIFPSGWEIHNTRMEEAESVIKSDYPTYQDIRDDRVYTYFNISPNTTKTFRIVLNAAYVGRYYLPTVYCEAMYDNTINSRKPGKWVEVVKPGE
ncbi:MAG: MG2 domain-containing protein [Bacteroidota bacterium]|nr:MG2 domain-containing protein [Bacteroidota bacterium]